MTRHHGARAQPWTTWSVTVGIILVVGIVLYAAGATPWPAAAATLAALWLGFGQRLSWSAALAAAVTVMLAAAAVVVRVAPLLPVGLVAVGSASGAVLGAVGLLLLARSREAARLPRIRLGGIVTAALAVVATTAFVVRGSSDAVLRWAMGNDAVWNLVTMRAIVADGGIDSAVHPNSSPLSPALFAFVAATGRSRIEPADLLAHDVRASASIWLVLAVTTAVLAASIGWRSARRAGRTARILAAALVGVLPLTWFVFGFASIYGFHNATIALVLLLASWLIWLDSSQSRALRGAILSFAAVALLATWAPLAVIPLGLAGVVLAEHVWRLARAGSTFRSYLPVALAAAPAPVYVVTVTLADLRRDGSALAVDGAILPLQQIHVLVIAAVALATAVVLAATRAERWALGGMVVVLGTSMVAGGYLVLQRAGAGSPWGYYPAKFAWLVVTMLLILLAAGVASALSAADERRWVVTAATLATVLALPLVLMSLVPPAGGRLANSFAPLRILTDDSGGADVARLFALAEPGERTLVAEYAGGDADRFLNSWLLQLESEAATDPIRTFSYILDPSDDAQVCAAIVAWDAPVRVITSDVGFGERLTRGCDAPSFVVDVRSP